MTPGHAEAIIREIIESYTDCPAPCEIRRIAGILRPRGERFTSGCKNCDGTGWKPMVSQKGVPGVEPCECRGSA